jgi:hypothetical protein
MKHRCHFLRRNALWSKDRQAPNTPEYVVARNPDERDDSPASFQTHSAHAYAMPGTAMN